jgi:hypothetical protein
MSGPADVLADLQGVVRIAKAASLGVTGNKPRIERAEQAIAAFAELIEAAKMANGDHSAPHDCYATGPLTGDPVMDLVVCPGCRLAAALANVGGAK